jgi:hypothetical protein
MPLWREEANLWTLLLPPTVWAGHFLFAYGFAAVVCAKGGGAEFDSIRLAVAAATAVALTLIALSGVQAHRHWGFGDDLPPHDQPTDDDRQRFLGFATLLLCALSAVGVVFVSLPIVFVADCR